MTGRQTTRSRGSIPPLCLLLTFFLTACSEKPAKHDYFPLQEGLSWTYKVTTQYPSETRQSELTITSLGKHRFGDDSYAIRRTSSGIDYYLNQDETGIYRQGLRTLVELKPRLDRERRYVLKRPFEVGTLWEDMTQPLLLLRLHPYRQRVGKEVQIPFSYRIESTTSSVSVPAGDFEHCIKVVAEGLTEIYTDAVNGYSEIPFKMVEWYAPGIGLVKQARYELYDQTITSMGTPIFVGGSTTLELSSYQQ